MSQYKFLIRKNFAGIAGTAFLIVLMSLAMTFAGYSLSFFFRAYEYEGDKIRAICYTFVIVTAIWLSAMLLYYISLLAQAKIGQKLKNELRYMIGGRIGSLSFTDFTDKDSGNYVSWLTNDVEQIYSQSFQALFSGIENMGMAVFSFGALMFLSPWIGFAAIVLLIIISVLPQLTNKRLQKANLARSVALEHATESYKEVVMGGSIFFLPNLRGRIRERILAASEKSERVCYRYGRTSASVQILTSTISMVGQIILLFVTLLAAVLGAASASALLAVGNLAGSFFNGAGSFVQSFITIRAAKPLWEKFQDCGPGADGWDGAFQDCGTGINGGDDAFQDCGPGADGWDGAFQDCGPGADGWNGAFQDCGPGADGWDRAASVIPEIKLENLSFGYGGSPVLHNKNYTFKAGGKYAVVGESGSGKTTLARIILGLLPGYSGKVLYGDLEQKDIRMESLYDHIAYVDQQVYLFQDTVRFNITLGELYTDEEVAAVIRKCRLEDYVQSLPEGLNTVIMENGKNLSGGQRQRIALARSLIRKVQYIILDEGTSALDEKNAVEIESSLLDDPSLGIIIITHNLRETVRHRFNCICALSRQSGG